MRVIDADELEKNLSNDLPYKGSVKRVLIQAPTVDAVEVVRCKDCKRSYIYKQKNEGMVYCAIHGMSKNGNGFCEEGVPKDGD